MGKVIGIDLGDRKSHYCVLNEDGIVIEEGTVQTTPAAFSKHFAAVESSLIALEVCGHSRWTSRVPPRVRSRSSSSEPGTVETNP